LVIKGLHHLFGVTPFSFAHNLHENTFQNELLFVSLRPIHISLS
jgi:hypothetical protein